MTKQDSNTSKTSGALILCAWLVVGLPLAWGVYNTWQGAMKLFQSAPASAPATVNR